MAKRYMSEDDYLNQQYKYKNFAVDPSILASVVDDKSDTDIHGEDEETKRIRQEAKETLIKLIKNKIKKVCTARQQEAIELFLLQKKQEHMGEILGVTQEAANVRLKLGIERLKKECAKDGEILEVLKKLKD